MQAGRINLSGLFHSQKPCLLSFPHVQARREERFHVKNVVIEAGVRTNCLQMSKNKAN